MARLAAPAPITNVPAERSPPSRNVAPPAELPHTRPARISLGAHQFNPPDCILTAPARADTDPVSGAGARGHPNCRAGAPKDARGYLDSARQASGSCTSPSFCQQLFTMCCASPVCPCGVSYLLAAMTESHIVTVIAVCVSMILNSFPSICICISLTAQRSHISDVLDVP